MGRSLRWSTCLLRHGLSHLGIDEYQRGWGERGDYTVKRFTTAAVPYTAAVSCLPLSHQRFCLPVWRKPLSPAPSDAFVPTNQGHPASSQQPWGTNAQTVHETLQVRRWRRFMETDVEMKAGSTGDSDADLHVWVIVVTAALLCLMQAERD